jgi:FkbM family methyltransferase
LIRSIAKRTIHKLGYDIRRYAPSNIEAARLQSMLTAHQVNLVFDVGANKGQFARSFREAGYRGRIVSFEPLPEPWNHLQDAVHADLLWELAPRGAIGAEDGEVEFHVAGNLVSSSALGLLDTHLEIAPDSKYVGSERVPLRRLDTIGPGYLRPDSNLFIKVDVQGYEHHVLAGARELLDRAVGLHLEMLFVPLYEGQVTYDELIREVRALGFELWDFQGIIKDPKTCRMLWADAIFFRCEADPGAA